MKRKIISIPPNYFYLAIILTVVFHFILPKFNYIQSPYNYLGVILIILGLWLTIWPWQIFKKHNTSERFVQSKALVTEGPYEFSRNPMYLGMTLVLLGLVIVIQNILSFIFPVLFFLVIHFMFVPYEEEKNEQDFGQKYLGYKNKVRKWI